LVALPEWLSRWFLFAETSTWGLSRWIGEEKVSGMLFRKLRET